MYDGLVKAVYHLGRFTPTNVRKSDCKAVFISSHKNLLTVCGQAFHYWRYCVDE